MSQRILAFTDSAMIFLGPKKSLMKGVATPLDKLGWYNSINRVAHDAPEELSWIDIAIGYSGRHGGFTKPVDFLPGLSGIAAWFASRKRLPADTYYAGLWGYNLHYGLVWSTDKPTVTELAEFVGYMWSRETYICPSWSWGLLGNVKWPWFGEKRMCDLGVKMKRKKGELAEFGEPEYAHLIIEGRVVDLPSDLHRVRLGTTGNRFKWQADVEAIDPHGNWVWELDWVPAEPLLPRGDLKMVLTGSDLKTHKEYLVGIIIHPVKKPWLESHENVYVRVGTFRRLPMDRWVVVPKGPQKVVHTHYEIHKRLPIPFFGRQETRTVYVV